MCRHKHVCKKKKKMRPLFTVRIFFTISGVYFKTRWDRGEIEKEIGLGHVTFSSCRCQSDIVLCYIFKSNGLQRCTLEPL